MYFIRKDQENLKINPNTNTNKIDNMKIASSPIKTQNNNTESKGKFIGNEDDFWYGNNEGNGILFYKNL